MERFSSLTVVENREQVERGLQRCRSCRVPLPCGDGTLPAAFWRNDER